MRLNKFLADNTELSRRKADVAIENGRIAINGQRASLGTVIESDDKVTIDGQLIKSKEIKIITVLLNKPVGYVCSKDGQGSKTVYDFGYLYTVSDLHFWEREELQAKNNKWKFWYQNIWDVLKIIGVKK